MKFTSPSGRTYEWDKPEPPTQADIDALVAYEAQQGLGAPSPKKTEPTVPPTPQDVANKSAPTPYGIGPGATPQAPQAISANLVRYGVPAGVGFAVGGPIGGVAGLGSAMVPSAVSGFLSEMAARGVEGKDVFSQEGLMAAGGAGIEAGAPVVRLSRGARPAVASFLATAASNVGLQELGDFARTGEFKLPDKKAVEIAKSWAVPIGVSTLAGVGRVGQAAGEAVESAEAISKSRFGGRVMLSEVFPGMRGFEIHRLRSGNTAAHDALRDLDSNIGDAIATAYRGVPNESEVARKVAEIYDGIAPLRNEAKAARDNADALKREYEKARAIGRADAQQLKEQVQVAELNKIKTRALYEDGLKRIFGTNVPSIDTVAAGARQQLLADTAEAAKNSVDTAIGALYQKAGVGINDPVVSLSEVMQEINARAKKGGKLEGDIARAEIKDAVTEAFGDSREMSLEAYRRFQSDIAEQLVKKGKDPRAANRIAAGAYDAMRSAADKTMARALPDIQYRDFMAAQEAAAIHFAAREADAIKYITKADSEGLLNAIEKFGAGKVLNELDSYAKALAEVSNRAVGVGLDPLKVAAANSFKDDVFALIRDGLIDRATIRDTGVTDMLQAVDAGKLAGLMHSLRTKGVDLALVGVDANDISRLAKIHAKEIKTPLTKSDLNEFLQLVPSMGADDAARRIAYKKAVANTLMASGAKEKANALRAQSKLARDANVSAEEAERVFREAAANPIVQFFDTNNTRLLLDKDPAKNSQWVSRILDVDPKLVDGFVASLRSAKKTDILDDLGKAAEFSVLDTFRKAWTETGSRMKLDDITHTFFGNDAVASNRREALKKIIGEDRYRIIDNQFVRPAADIIKTRTSLGVPTEMALRDLQSAMAAGSLVQGKPSAGVIFGNAMRAVWNTNMGKAYNVLHGLILDPKNNRELARFGYDLDRYAAASPVNAALLRTLQEKDKQDQRP